MRFLTCALLCALSGCGGALRTVRDDKPLQLSTGTPLNECERGEWYELVPTLAFSSLPTDGPPGVWTTLKPESKGIGIYLFARETPMALGDFLPKLELPELSAAHMARIQGIHKREALANSIGLLAAGMTVGSLAFMLIPTTQMLGVVLLVVALAVELGSLTLIPPIDELTYARLRDSVLLPDEDDISAVVEAVTRLNGRRRAHCSSHP